MGRYNPGGGAGGSTLNDVMLDGNTTTKVFLGPDGTAALPTYSFSSDPNTGLYSAAGDLLGFTVGGTVMGSFGATGFSIIGTVLADPGTAALPAFAIRGDDDTGMYKVSNNTLGFSTFGVHRATIDSSGLAVTGAITATTTIDATTTMSGTAITATTGDLTATLGDVVVSAGDVDVTLGSVVVAAGDVSVTEGNQMSFKGPGNNDFLKSTTNDFEFLRSNVRHMKFTGDTVDSQNVKFDRKIVVQPKNTGATRISINVEGFHTGAVNITSLEAIRVESISSSGGDSTDAIGMLVKAGTLGGGGAWTNQYGINIQNIALGTNNWAIKTGTGLVDFGDALSVTGSITATTTITGTVLTATTGDVAVTLGDVVVAAGDVDVTLGSVDVAAGDLNVTLGDLNAPAGVVLASDGTALLPAFAATSDPDTGMYNASADKLAFATGGVVRFTTDSTGLKVVSGPILTLAFTESAPAFGFTGDLDTGMFKPGTNELGFTTGGTNRCTVSSAGIAVVGAVTATTTLTATTGIVNVQSVANFSSPPTDAELDSAFGTPATVGRGFIATLDDNDDDTAGFTVWASDASWYYIAGTKAV